MVRTAFFALAAAAATPAAAQQLTALAPGETLLEVQAEGEAWIRPDTATINVGVVSTGVTARAATDANATAMAAVIAAVKGAGVPARAIRTQQINVQPRFARSGNYDYDGQAQITGYVARNSVSVTVEKLVTAPDVVAAAFGAGANSVSGPSLGTADPRLGIAEARDDAIKNARAEADAYAAGLGMKVARVIRLSERGSNVRETSDIVVTGRMVQSAPPPPPPPSAPPAPIEGGVLKRSTTIWVDFALTR